MGILTSVWAFVLAIAVLVVFHELGHYVAARLCGVKVQRFSLGFGPVIWSRRLGPDATEWAVSAVPLGGYVKMVDERESTVAPEDLPRAFNRQSLAVRSAIVAAGPFANFLLAVILYASLGVSGIDDIRAVLGEAPDGSPVQLAGLGQGERILSIDGNDVTGWSDVRWLVMDAVLDRRPIAIETLDSNGNFSQRRISIPHSIADAPDQDVLSALGFRPPPPRLPPVIGRIVDGSPAATAGLMAGDRITRIDGRAVDTWDGFAATVRRMPGAQAALEIVRGGTVNTVAVAIGVDASGGVPVGRIGAAPAVPANFVDERGITVRRSLIDSVGYGVTQTWQVSVLTLRLSWRMVIGEVSWKNISGPVTIADYAGQTAQLGAGAFARFLALISVSLGVLNLLPIPILDGGHLLYHLAEFINGRALSERVIEVGQQVGMTILALLMMFAFYNDFNRLLSG